METTENINSYEIQGTLVFLVGVMDTWCKYIIEITSSIACISKTSYRWKERKKLNFIVVLLGSSVTRVKENISRTFQLIDTVDLQVSANAIKWHTPSNTYLLVYNLNAVTIS